MMDTPLLYKTLQENIREDTIITSYSHGDLWSYAETSASIGLAMWTETGSRPPSFSLQPATSIYSFAPACLSWNFEEASTAVAAVNSYYNTVERLKLLQAEDVWENHYCKGIDFFGKTVGIIGHMRGPSAIASAKRVYTLERNPKPGDFPDSACEYLLPECDIVIITGSSIINKTLPRLLQLTENAYTILTGPTVPMCPELLDIGINRLAGFIVTNPAAIKKHVLQGYHGGKGLLDYSVPFLLTSD